MTPRIVRAAAVQAEPVVLDLPASLDKACRLIAEAGAKGAKLIVFPELFLTTYINGSIWGRGLSRFGNDRARAAWLRLWNNSVAIPGAGDGPSLRGRTRRRRGRRDGAPRAGRERPHALQHHPLHRPGRDHRQASQADADQPRAHGPRLRRRLDPLGLRHARPDASAASPAGRISCRSPASRSTPPASRFTSPRPPSTARWRSSMPATPPSRAASSSSRCAWCFGRRAIPPASNSPTNSPPPTTGWRTATASSSPRTGRILAGPVHREETILYADLDLDETLAHGQLIDTTGHYARPDVLSLRVNRAELPPVQREI